MRFYLGIDGGGTRTRAFLTDEAARRMAWGEAGLSNPNHAAPDEARANLAQAIGEALAKLGLDLSACVSVFVGMAGVTMEDARARLERFLRACGLEHAKIGVDHDIRAALAGGLALEPGVALIVGTGSSCYGRTAGGRTWQTGGWEALISDEGSAFYVAREAMAAAARMADGRARETPLRKAVFDWLGIEHIAQILPRIHDQGLSRSQIAALAPTVITLGEQDDPAALEILSRGAALLSEMVAANHRMLPTGPGPDVVITGGLGTAATVYRRRIVEAIRAELPSVRIREPRLAPAIGAALLAMEQSGRKIGPELIERLEQFAP